MEVKEGVQLSGLQPEMIVALMVIKPILAEADQDLVLTSATDSKHSRKSRHYIGYGMDIRSRDVADDQKEIVADKLSKALGYEFYVVYEHDHYHIQFNGSPRI